MISTSNVEQANLERFINTWKYILPHGKKTNNFKAFF